MSSIKTMIVKVQKALDSPFDLSKLDRAIKEMHTALSDEDYAIKDLILRHEMEQMVISYTVRRMLEPETPEERKHRLSDHWSEL